MFEKEAEEYCTQQKLLEDVRDNICNAFQDGVKFGYNKANEWHDLRKNSSDLPPLEPNSKRFTITVIMDEGKLAYYSYIGNYWIDDASGDEIDRVVAWCEIPKFEEK